MPERMQPALGNAEFLEQWPEMLLDNFAATQRPAELVEKHQTVAIALVVRRCSASSAEIAKVLRPAADLGVCM